LLSLAAVAAVALVDMVVVAVAPADIELHQTLQ
jgi:hypothetical protein